MNGLMLKDIPPGWGTGPVPSPDFGELLTLLARTLASGAHFGSHFQSVSKRPSQGLMISAKVTEGPSASSSRDYIPTAGPDGALTERAKTKPSNGEAQPFLKHNRPRPGP